MAEAAASSARPAGSGWAEKPRELLIMILDRDAVLLRHALSEGLTGHRLYGLPAAWARAVDNR